jgi:hypothetical protein
MSRWVLILLAGFAPCAIAGQAADPLPAWLAELASGDARAANWHWRSALALDPAAASYDPERFGEWGERLESWSDSDDVGLDGQPRQQEVILRVGGDVVAPRRILGPNPTCAGAPCQGGARTRVILQFIIEERGEPSFPKLFKTEGSPAATLATLEEIRCWRFHPARVNKELRAVYYTVVEGERR